MENRTPEKVGYQLRSQGGHHALQVGRRDAVENVNGPLGDDLANVESGERVDKLINKHKIMISTHFFGFILMMVRPVTLSPARMACWMGEAPRHRGSSEPWMLRMPVVGDN